jgi:hypothetical protein
MLTRGAESILCTGDVAEGAATALSRSTLLPLRHTVLMRGPPLLNFRTIVGRGSGFTPLMFGPVFGVFLWSMSGPSPSFGAEILCFV